MPATPPSPSGVPGSHPVDDLIYNTIFRGDFFTRVGRSLLEIFRGDLFYRVGPSVPEIFRGVFSSEWDHLCPRYLGVIFVFTRVGLSLPEIFKGDFFLPKWDHL